MANFCQKVLKLLGSYTRVFNVILVKLLFLSEGEVYRWANSSLETGSLKTARSAGHEQRLKKKLGSLLAG